MEILSVIKHFMNSAASQVKFHRHIMKIDNLDRGFREVLTTIDELYQLFPEKGNITPTELTTYFCRKFPSRDITYLTDIIKSAQEQTIGPEITINLIEAVIERHMAAKIAAVCAPVIGNQKTGVLSDVDEIMYEYRELCSTASQPDDLSECTMSFQEAIEYRAHDTGLRWPLKILNDCIGGYQPASLGLVIARPDTGKTSFVLNSIAFLAHQLRGTDHQMLYCNNEEHIIGIKARFGVSLLGCNSLWAEQNPKEFDKQVSKKNGNCVRFHGGVRSTRAVEMLIKRYKPIVVVADQIAKIRIPGATKEGPAGLSEQYNWFRDKGQVNNFMTIAVAQAGTSAGQWITMDDINASKTDVPGELDWGIGIGMVHDPGMEHVRFVNVYKNKYGRKGRAQVKFDPDTCRYKD